MNLADRINLYFKIGNFVDIDFSIEEMIYVNKVDSCETFEEVLDVAEELYNYCKQQMDQQESIAPIEGTGENEGSLEENDTPADGQGEEKDGEVDMEYQPKSSLDSGPVLEDFEDMGGNMGGDEYNDEPQAETVKSLSDALKNLVENTGVENSYIEMPEIYLDKLIIPNNAIYQICEQHWDDTVNSYKESSYYRENPHFAKTAENLFEHVDGEFYKFKKSAQKEVNYLVKEFEMKKSAGGYARATTARTGVLDTAKLHSYKYSEDLF